MGRADPRSLYSDHDIPVLIPFLVCRKGAESPVFRVDEHTSLSRPGIQFQRAFRDDRFPVETGHFSEGLGRTPYRKDDASSVHEPILAVHGIHCQTHRDFFRNRRACARGTRGSARVSRMVRRDSGLRVPVGFPASARRARAGRIGRASFRDAVASFPLVCLALPREGNPASE